MITAPALCPCCGAPLDPAKLVLDLSSNVVARNGNAVKLRPGEAILLDAMAKAAPVHVTRDSLFALLWGDEEPEQVLKSFHVQMHRLRRRITPLGLRVATTRVHTSWNGHAGQGARYRLEFSR